MCSSDLITSEDISIMGISNNKLSVAEFEKGLSSIEGIGDIFVSNIIKEGIDYKFELEINRPKLKEVKDGTSKEKEEESEED